MSDEVASTAGRKAIWAWALYDFANSPFTTLVVTFVYSAYFTQAIAPDEVTGTALWSRAVTISSITVALLSPIAGAVADRGGLRKRFLGIATAVAVIGSIGLYPVLPGQVILALAWFVVANVAFEMGMVFYNAFLPEVAPAERIGRISGLGWGLGYLGGLLALAIALAALVWPEEPWFGFSKEAGENIRATNLLVAGWFAVFSLPIFLWVPERRPPKRLRIGALARESYGDLIATFRNVRRYRDTVRFLLARLLFNDGLVTVFSFGGIYAAGTFGFGFREILIFGIVLNVAAGAGAFLLGNLDDRLGGKRTLTITLGGLIAATLLAVVAPDRTWFWVAGILIGLCVGPNQSASRSLLGRFVPAGHENEFYGFYAFSGKATAFIGPLLLGLVTEWFDSQRAGVATILLLFLSGAVVLLGVDENRGRRRAAAALPTDSP